MITLIWTPSHKTHQESLKRGIPLEHWVANTIADSLAGKGAEESALEQEQIDLILGNEKKVHNILRRLVSIAVAIVPVGKHTACSANKGPCRGSGKLEGLERLARASGHSLTSLFKCVKCSLQLDLSLNRAYLENILTMPWGPSSSMLATLILMQSLSSTELKRTVHIPWPVHQRCAFTFVWHVVAMQEPDPRD